MRHIYIFLLILFFFSLFILPVYADLPTVMTSQKKLEHEIQKMLDAGHLRPAYETSESFIGFKTIGQASELEDLWANPADTLYTLALAYPHLSSSQKSQLVTYMEQEYQDFKPDTYHHMGTLGARREHGAEPQDMIQDNFVLYSSCSYLTQPSWCTSNDWQGWKRNPTDFYQLNAFNYYGLYKFAQVVQTEKGVNKAPEILSKLRARIDHVKDSYPPAPFTTEVRTDDYLKQRPHVLNSYIAGYIGWLGLQEMSGETKDPQIVTWLEEAKVMRLRHLRETESATLSQWEAGGFLWMVPELGDYLHSQDKNRVQYMVDTYAKTVPYWYVARAQEQDRSDTHMSNGLYSIEASKSSVYHYSSLFNAKAYALKEPKEELEKYLDVPSVWRGDLFYIQNLVATLNAQGSTTPPNCTLTSDINCTGRVDIVDLSLVIRNFGKSSASKADGDTNADGVVNMLDLSSIFYDFGKTQ